MTRPEKTHFLSYNPKFLLGKRGPPRCASLRGGGGTVGDTVATSGYGLHNFVTNASFVSCLSRDAGYLRLWLARRVRRAFCAATSPGPQNGSVRR